jgi:predicted Zn-dependent protease
MNEHGKLSRREFIMVGGVTAATVLSGCATNPVTGQSQFMLVSEQQELGIDQNTAPHQFSADYGAVQNPALNAYVDDVGKRIAGLSHRPQMPYSFRALNAVHVNAYTFPAGSAGVTRGILLAMEDESELGALLGHEVGHVNYRHMASRQSKAIVSQVALLAVVAVVDAKYKKYTALAAGLGALGSGLVLAKYSQQDERQADECGQAYLVKGGYHPDGMVHLMERLVALNKREPSALEVMFATHPPSAERYDTAVRRSAMDYASFHDQKTNRERYMDMTAPIRAQRDAIVAMQNGVDALGENKVEEAERQYAAALALQPQDYAGLLTMAKIQLAQKKFAEARDYANRARSAYPEEPQARQVCAMSALNQRQYEVAFADFDSYDRMLPGNSMLAFYKGYTLEQMGKKELAAGEFQRYLQTDSAGDQAAYATNRLTAWGYIKPPQPQPAPVAATPPAATPAANPNKGKKKKKNKNAN